MDTSNISIKHEFTQSINNSRNCRRYYNTLLDMGESLDVDYFYNSIFEYFDSYDYFNVYLEIDNTWEECDVWVKNLEYIKIEKDKKQRVEKDMFIQNPSKKPTRPRPKLK